MTDLYFAPMEGITDVPYRKTIMEIDPSWDFFSTDFLRIPTVGKLSKNRLLEHFGHEFYNSPEFKQKTIFQILTTPHANTEDSVKLINDLDFPYLDLNLGCPSRKVNAHLGGSYLLSVPQELKKVIRTIRKNFTNRFSVKMRIGYNDDSNFLENLKILEGEGVELITLHARTKKELYKGTANWDYLKIAKKNLTVPFIGNGDIWDTVDIDKVKDQTFCDHVMIGRGAMKTPWLASMYRNKIKKTEQLLFSRKMIPKYYRTLEENYSLRMKNELIILKRFKAVSRYIFDDFPQGETIKKECMRSKSLTNFYEVLKDI